MYCDGSDYSYTYAYLKSDFRVQGISEKLVIFSKLAFSLFVYVMIFQSFSVAYLALHFWKMIKHMPNQGIQFALNQFFHGTSKTQNPGFEYYLKSNNIPPHHKYVCRYFFVK